jgi:HAD superfamily hydrolase (TIGR01450 family)
MLERPIRDAAWAVRAYEAVRHRLPPVEPAPAPRAVGGIAEIAERYDAVLLDAFGVLNVGETAIPGAPDAVAALQRAGKRALVLTNSASQPPEAALLKYRRLGFDFAPEDVISSRDALKLGLARRRERRWGAMAPQGARIAELGVHAKPLGDDPAAYDACDGFILLGSGGWTEQRQRLLTDALVRRPRAVLVGNPDIVAPRESGLTLEPGHFAHRLADETNVHPEFFGKPFANIFDLAFGRLGGIPRGRILMVGDTLHTDVLGGRHAGVETLLLTDFGLFAGTDTHCYMAATGIFPTWTAPVL